MLRIRWDAADLVGRGRIGMNVVGRVRKGVGSVGEEGDIGAGLAVAIRCAPRIRFDDIDVVATPVGGAGIEDERSQPLFVSRVTPAVNMEAFQGDSECTQLLFGTQLTSGTLGQVRRHVHATDQEAPQNDHCQDHEDHDSRILSRTDTAVIEERTTLLVSITRDLVTHPPPIFESGLTQMAGHNHTLATVRAVRLGLRPVRLLAIWTAKPSHWSFGPSGRHLVISH